VEHVHRVMLVNRLRLLGAAKQKKASRNFVTRPTQVVLPLPPNHGLFDNDGLYLESKISLETLFMRWSSESWGEYLGLARHRVLSTIHHQQVCTHFWRTQLDLRQGSHVGVKRCRAARGKSRRLHVLCQRDGIQHSWSQVKPIWADLNGGMDHLPDLADITVGSRQEINTESSLCKAISSDNALGYKITNGTWRLSSGMSL
jgi:fatty acid synthase subunit alpha